MLDGITDDLMSKYNIDKPVVYNTFQLYRKDRLEFLKNSFQKAVDQGYILGAKLVRGAYMEKERRTAKRKNYESPIHETIRAVHADYNAGLTFCLNNIEKIGTCVASHNEESCQLYHQLINQLDLPRNHPHLMIGQLLGMGDYLTLNLARIGHNAMKYVPYGPVSEVIPYLIRRAEENSSVEGQMSRELRLLKEELGRRKT